MNLSRFLFTALLGMVSLAAVSCGGGDARGPLPEGMFLRSVFDGTSLRNTLFVFKNGQVAYNPAGDLENVDFGALAAANPGSVGTYSVSGSTLNITWGGGSTETGEMKPDKAGGFDYRSAPYAPLLPLAAGAVLEGRFTGGSSLPGISASVDYTFDGRGGYKTNAAGVAVTFTAGSTSTAGSSSEDAGTFTVLGSRITLTGSSGSRASNIYYVPTSAGAGNPDMIVLGGVVLTKG